MKTISFASTLLLCAIAGASTQSGSPQQANAYNTGVFTLTRAASTPAR